MTKNDLSIENQLNLFFEILGMRILFVACEPQKYFRSSLLSLRIFLFFGGRESTTGNTSAVHRPSSLGSDKMIFTRVRENLVPEAPV